MKSESFEENMNRLNEIVSKLENSDISLDEAMKLFEEGLDLVDTCNQKLNAFDEKLKKVILEHEKKNEDKDD